MSKPEHSWKKNLPRANIEHRPERRSHRLKFKFWRLYTPFHPYLHHVGKVIKRWPELYPLGSIAPHSSVEKVVAHLVSAGYGYHREAWEDDGEIVGLRKVAGFTHQYHLRIYENGEIRGHFEFTPEAYPLLHLFRVGQEARRDEFLTLLKDHIIPDTHDDHD